MKSFEHSAESELPPEQLRRELITDIVPALGRRKYLLASDSSDVIVMQREYRSWVVILLAVLLFPVGLLLLLIKSTAVVTIAFTDHGSGSLVEIAGSGPPEMVNWLQTMEI